MMNYYSSYIFPNSERRHANKGARRLHSVVCSRFVSLVNQVPHCLDNILHKTIMSNLGNTATTLSSIEEQGLGDYEVVLTSC